MPFCSCNDVTLFYKAQGDGPPLLLISGLSSGTWSWYGQVPFFQNHYLTVTFDNRGAGQSSMPPGPYHMKQFAEDARSLLDHLEIERTFLLGLSMGGMIAQELALSAPDRVKALVLGCTHFGGTGHIPPSDPVLEALLNNDSLSHEQIIRKNLPIFFSEEGLKSRPEAAEAYIEAQLGASLQPEHAFRAQLAAIASFDCRDRNSELSVPVLIITGGKDILVPPGNASLLAQSLKNAEVVQIPEAGHALHAESSEALNQLAHSFFQKHHL